METREIGKSSTGDLPEAKHFGFSRRTILTIAGALGAAAPFGGFGAARALTALPHIPGGLPICHAAASSEPLQGPPHQVKLAWNANAACTVAAPVAKEHGIFAKNNLDVEFVNFGGTTDQLLEAIATGKADAGLGLALRWLKPLEQGFDVRITTGIHGGCIRLLGSCREDRQSGIGACVLAAINAPDLSHLPRAKVRLSRCIMIRSQLAENRKSMVRCAPLSAVRKKPDKAQSGKCEAARARLTG